MGKNILLACTLMIFGSKGFGQFKKDNALIGTSASYSHMKNSRKNSFDNYGTWTNNEFKGNLRFGYFFKDRFALGLLGGYQKTTTKTNDYSVSNLGEMIQNSTYYQKTYSIGPFARFYKIIMDKKLAFFCQLDASYLSGKSEGSHKGSTGGVPIQSRDPEGKIRGVIAGVHPGFVYFIREKIGIEASFGTFNYNYQVNQSYIRSVKTQQSSSGGLNLNFGLNTFFLGVSFYLHDKKA